MPFDPNIPQPNTEIDADQMRAQLTSLKSLIDAAPGLTDVVIDGVTTLPPGEPASATVSMVRTASCISPLPSCAVTRVCKARPAALPRSA